MHVSHWSGPLAQLDIHTDWAFNGQAHDLFGRLTYAGNPVYGFGIGKDGAPNDRYGRSLYIDTFDSAYGAGWKRETSISFRRGSGAFCYSSGQRTTRRCPAIRTTHVRPETASATASLSKGPA